MAKILWRLEGATDISLHAPARLAQGLRLHLQHTELTGVLMQLGEQQQAYLAAAACAGCAYGRCAPGCYVELLRRLLRASFTSATLAPVAGGLARRPYRRVALAWPTAHAQPLSQLRLIAWADARLVVRWRGVAGAALLAVGADGPEPASTLRAIGWTAWSLPPRPGAWMANSPLPRTLPFLRACPHTPMLLWPQSIPDTPQPEPPFEEQAEPNARLDAVLER